LAASTVGPPTSEGSRPASRTRLRDPPRGPVEGSRGTAARVAYRDLRRADGTPRPSRRLRARVVPLSEDSRAGERPSGNPRSVVPASEPWPVQGGDRRVLPARVPVVGSGGLKTSCAVVTASLACAPSGWSSGNASLAASRRCARRSARRSVSRPGLCRTRQPRAAGVRNNYRPVPEMPRSVASEDRGSRCGLQEGPMRP
jgi:hypothetical protein